jgi:hypothetical protein
MPSDLLENLLASMSRETIEKLDRARQIKHGPEAGRGRESVYADFLSPLIPDDFAISTGFALDAAGGLSEQLDLLIHRTGYHPVFVVAGVSYFPIESITAVFQSKADCSSTARLRQAFDNIASVKTLDRTNAGKNYVLHERIKGVDVDPDTTSINRSRAFSRRNHCRPTGYGPRYPSSSAHTRGESGRISISTLRASSVSGQPRRVDRRPILKPRPDGC